MDVLDSLISSSSGSVINPDLPHLIDMISNETHSPELLPYDDVAEKLLQMLQEQKMIVDTQLLVNISDESMFVHEYQLECERVQYLITKYFRLRLLKIQTQADSIVSSTTYMSYLSFQEKQFLDSFYDLNREFLQDSIYSKIESQSCKEKFMNSKDLLKHAQPDMKKFIFFEATEDVGDLDLQDGKFQYVRKGDICIAFYSAVQRDLLEQKLKLV